jgi:phosphosulfolactate synthase
MERANMLEQATRIFGAVAPDRLGRSAVIDRGLGAGTVEDFVALARPILSEWKLGWTTWLLADRRALLRKIGSLHSAGITVVAGGTAGEIAASRGSWSDFVKLCSDLGIHRIELAEGFLGPVADPAILIEQAHASNLEVQYEVGRKDVDEDRAIGLATRMEMIQRWADAGAEYFVIEAREVGAGFALFPERGQLNTDLTSALLSRLPLSRLIFETPTRSEYTAVLKALGPGVCLSNIYPEEIFRVETMRRAIHADTVAYQEKWSGYQ